MAEIYVTSTADSGAGSLRQAIANAQNGDVILFDADVFPAGQTTSILLSSYLTINKSISIYGGFNDGAGGYTSGASKSYYVYRDIDGVKTKVAISAPDEAQEGEIVLFDNVCRVALDGQATQYPDAMDEWSGWTGSRVMVIQQDGTGAVIKGLTLCNGVSDSNGAGALLHGDAAIDGLFATFIDCAFVSGVNTSGSVGGISCRGNWIYSLSDCNICDCRAKATGGGVYVVIAASTTLDNCIISNCTATNGGGLYSTSTSQNTLNDCVFYSCSATTNGGGIYSANTSQNTLNDCTITGCSATNGGGVCSASTSQNTLNNCTFDGCSATRGGATYSGNISKVILNNCDITNNTSSNAACVNITAISQHDINNCTILNNTPADVYVYNSTATLNIIDGINKVGNFKATNGATISIADGAALTLTGTATIGAATFTSDGRGYLAVAAGIDTSAATLTNVVLCSYGADVSSFVEVDGVLEWVAANPSTTVLIERADGDSWTTVAQPTGESLTLYLPPSATVRLFDGVQFFTAQAPDVRTYYYIGGADGSFTSAADWSLRRGGAAITEPPVVRGQRFIVGDISPGE